MNLHALALSRLQVRRLFEAAERRDAAGSFGRRIYSCATSAAPTEPVLVIVADTVATTSNNDATPSGTRTSTFGGAKVGAEPSVQETETSEYEKLE